MNATFKKCKQVLDPHLVNKRFFCSALKSLPPFEKALRQLEILSNREDLDLLKLIFCLFVF